MLLANVISVGKCFLVKEYVPSFLSFFVPCYFSTWGTLPLRTVEGRQEEEGRELSRQCLSQFFFSPSSFFLPLKGTGELSLLESNLLLSTIRRLSFPIFESRGFFLEKKAEQIWELTCETESMQQFCFRFTILTMFWLLKPHYAYIFYCRGPKYQTRYTSQISCFG